ncbi:MAG: pyrroline-5-carboxylate reductase [Candidatus Verstraetearchaeota archaeon]|nr:pyrroline-5-carboxylate reductase [Candidatus Verstraetearchaeota archaeon]
MKIGLIGYGRMGVSFIKGLLRNNVIDSKSIFIYDINEERLKIAEKNGLMTIKSLSELKNCNIIIIAIKPKDYNQLLDNIKNEINPNSIIISFAAGIRISYIESKLGENTKIVRIMPNICASIGEAVFAILFNKNVKEDEKLIINKIFENLGMVIPLENEDLIDVITGLSGSGPAYFFLIMKYMVELGKKYGLKEDIARKLVAQTCKGAGLLVLQSKEDFDELIKMVATPSGVTEEALKIMISRGIKDIIYDSISTAIEKTKLIHSNISK